jgi:hypothetical protein
MTLQAKLDAFKADFEAGKSPYSVARSMIETMHHATQELISSGAAPFRLGSRGNRLGWRTKQAMAVKAGGRGNV